MLLLWLSILVLIPFDLVILDSEVTCGSSRAAAQVAYPPLAAKIMNLCKAYLQHPGGLSYSGHGAVMQCMVARFRQAPELAQPLVPHAPAADVSLG